MDERTKAILHLRKRIEENETIVNRVRDLRNQIKARKQEYLRTEEQVKSLQSVGQISAELMRQISPERYMVKASSGPRYLVGIRTNIDTTKLKVGTRVALDFTTLTIMRLLPREVDPLVFSMKHNTENDTIEFQDVGGLQEQLRQLREVIELPITNPELFQRVGIKPPKGVLLYGPPGTGKTLLAKAIATNVEASFLRVVASSIVDKYIGESARVIREMFAYAREHEPCIIFMDEIDAIGGKRIEGSSSDREIQRTLMELLNQMDGFDALGKVKVIMATNRPDTLDSALTRPGRIDRKVEIPLPNESSRTDILRIHASKLQTSGETIDYESIARLCENFNGADLRNVCTEAGMFALREDRSYVTADDFSRAGRKVSETKKLEGQAHSYGDQ